MNWKQGLGGLFILIGMAVIIFSWVALPQLMDNALDYSIYRRIVPMVSLEDQYKQFKKAPSYGFQMDTRPRQLTFQLYHIENVDRVVTLRESPEIIRSKKYVYDVFSRKFDVRFKEGVFQNEKHTIVSYRLHQWHHFNPNKSTGSMEDQITTVNLPYLQTLAELRRNGASEDAIQSYFVYRHLARYRNRITGPFLAHSKQKALKYYLVHLHRSMRRSSMRFRLSQMRDEVGLKQLHENTRSYMKAVRRALVPVVLRQTQVEISHHFLPQFLKSTFETRRRDLTPLTISNVYNRLHKEALPVLLQQLFAAQTHAYLPYMLKEAVASSKLEVVGFPAIMFNTMQNELMIEAVPLVLDTIKKEIKQQFINKGDNNALAMQNTLTLWRQGTSSVNLDAIVGGTATGSKRTGFELNRYQLPGMSLSSEAATIIMGESVGNVEYAIVNHNADAQVAGVGFSLWKQLILAIQNQTLIPQYSRYNQSSASAQALVSRIVTGINAQLSNSQHHITQNQTLHIASYLVNWTESDIVYRDRIRLWRSNFTLRTALSSTEPRVQLVSNSLDFAINQTKAGTSISAATALHLWTRSHPLALTNPAGWVEWMKLVNVTSVRSATVNATLRSETLAKFKAAFPDTSTAQLDAIVDWLTSILQSSWLRNQIYRHWTSPLCSWRHLARKTCAFIDIEPSVHGNQVGFEVNPNNNQTFALPLSLVQYLWDPSKPYSFLASSTDGSTGYQVWEHAIPSSKRSSWATSILINGIKSGMPSLAASFTLDAMHILHIGKWLAQLKSLPSIQQTAVMKWQQSTCRPSKLLENLTLPTIPSMQQTNLSSCTENKVFHLLKQEITYHEISPHVIWNSSYIWNITTCVPWGSSKFNQTFIQLRQANTTYQCDKYPMLPEEHPVLPTLASAAFPTLLNSDAIELTNSSTFPPSLKILNVLLNSSYANVSLLHLDGIKKWLTLSSTEIPAFVNEINTLGASSTCLERTQVGASSFIHNSSAFNLYEQCRNLTSTQLLMIKTWVEKMRASPFLTRRLLQHWRNVHNLGALAHASIPLEPVKGSQSAIDQWQIDEQDQTLPVEAEVLFDRFKCPISFLHATGFNLWMAASDANDPQAKAQIQAYFKLTSWKAWLKRIGTWVKNWQFTTYSLHYTLGHWQYTNASSCSYSQQHPGWFMAKQASKITPVASCTNQTSNSSTLLQAVDVASVAAYFSRTIAQDEARDQRQVYYSKVQTQQTCVNSSYANITTKHYHYFPCANRSSYVEFELVAPRMAFDVGEALWNSSFEYCFTSPTTFTTKWKASFENSTIQTQIIQAIQTKVASSFTVAEFLHLRKWIFHAYDNTTAFLEFADREFISSKPLTYTQQHNFNLQYKANGLLRMSPKELPTLGIVRKLWSSDFEFAFMSHSQPAIFAMQNQTSSNWDIKLDESNVTGYDAWVMLFQENSPKLIQRMTKATQLSTTQLQAIAAWLDQWQQHESISQYIHSFPTAVNLRFLFTYPCQQRYGTGTTYCFPQQRFAPALPHRKFSGTPMSLKQWELLWTSQQSYAFSQQTALKTWCLVLANNATATKPWAFACHPLNITEQASIITAINATLQLPLSQFQSIARYYLETLPSSAPFRYITYRKWTENMKWNRSNEGFDVHFALNGEFTSRERTAKQHQLNLNGSIKWWRNNSLAASTQRNFTAYERQIVESNITPPFINPYDALRLWNASNLYSFLHPQGWTYWQMYVDRQIPLATFRKQLQLVGFRNETINIVGAWLSSWLNHPVHRERLEKTWYHPTAKVHSSPYSLNQTTSSSLWPIVAELVWDPVYKYSFLHPEGSIIWRSMLKNCATSTPQGKCSSYESSYPKLSPQDNLAKAQGSAYHARIASSARESLLEHFVRAITAKKAFSMAKTEEVALLVDHIVDKWFVPILENEHFLQFMLGTNPSLSSKELPLHQFQNGSLTQLYYPQEQGYWIPASRGFQSEATKGSNQSLKWSAESQSIILQAPRVFTVARRSPVEVLPYCRKIRHNCTRELLELSLTKLKDLWQNFGNDHRAANLDAEWTGLPTGAIAAHVFLNQPYSNLALCHRHASTLYRLFNLTPAASKILCLEQEKGTFWVDTGLNLFPFSDSSVLQKDLQHYLRYLARVAVSNTSSSQVEHAMGYFTTQKVDDLLMRQYLDPLIETLQQDQLQNSIFGKLQMHTRSFQLWHNQSFHQANASNKDYEIVAVPSLATSVKQINRIAIMQRAQGHVLPTPVSDGSQFRPLLGQNLEARPQEYSFWWTLAQTPMTMKYERSVTRFGIQVAQYRVDQSHPFPLNVSNNFHPVQGVLSAPPTQEKHSFVEIEPSSGIVFRQSFKSQFQVELESSTVWNKNFHGFYPPRRLFPVYEVEEEAAVESRVAEEFKSEVYGNRQVKSIAPVLLSIGSGVLLILGFCLCFSSTSKIRKRKKKPTKQKLAPAPSSASAPVDLLQQSDGIVPISPPT